MTRGFPDCGALVTGGRRGIGRAFAVRLASLGCRVRIATRSPDAAETAETLRAIAAASESWAAASGSEPRPPRALPWSLEDAASAKELAAVLAAEDGPQILIHAAHDIGPHQLIVGTPPEKLAASLHRNVVGAYALCRALCRSMSRQGFGRVLFIGSLAAVLGGQGQVCYVVEKSALEGMMRAFAAELGKKGVLVNLVHPGIVDTENVRERVRPEIREAYASRTAAGRLLSPDDVVFASLGLIDPRQAGVTGQCLRIAGGVDLGAALLAEGSGQ